MQSPPFPRYLVPPRSEYSSQHHILKHPQLPFLPQCQRKSSTVLKVIKYCTLNHDLMKQEIMTAPTRSTFL